MRIGIMLRAAAEKGGVGVYTRNIARHLVATARQHDFVLYVRRPEDGSGFAAYPNATVREVHAPGKFLWDQVAIPWRFRGDRLDAIFHPKFTVPLLCAGRSAMVLHGAGWFIPETRQYWSRASRIYARLMMPLYCRTAGAVLSVSNITRDVFIERLGVSADKIETVYFAPGDQFNRRCTPPELTRIREKYSLPEEYILTVSGADRDDRKNFAGILEAYRRIHERRRVSLVVAGRGCDALRQRYRLPDTGYGADILFPGWIEQAELPALYQMAALFLYPSNMEAFPIPITEALASGTPTVTSNVFGLKELAGDAALLVDPRDADAIADASLALLDDIALRETLRSRAAERSKLFDWERCAHRTIAILERIGRR